MEQNLQTLSFEVSEIWQKFSLNLDEDFEDFLESP